MIDCCCSPPPSPDYPHSISYGWGAWRHRREFVGIVGYGVRYLLWNPETHTRFAASFQDAVRTLLLCQRRAESPVSWLGDDCLFYIFNVRYNIFNIFYEL